MLLDCGARVRFDLCLTNPNVTVFLGQSTSMSMRVSSKTSMSNTSFHNFDPSSNGLAIFQEININFSLKLYALRWRRLRQQIRNSAILCEPSSQKSRVFLPRRNFPPCTRGLLAFLCSLGKLRGNPELLAKVGLLAGQNPAGPISCFASFTHIGQN